MADDDFAQKYGTHVQVVVALLFFFESLMMSFLKATLVFYLRFGGQQTENISILSYHLLQMVSYFSAYINGLVSMQSIQISLIILMILYVIGAGCLAAAFLAFSGGDRAVPIMIALFGLGHGALKAVIHRMMKVERFGNTFSYMAMTLMLCQGICLGVIPMREVDSYPMVILGLLGVVFLLLLISIVGSLFDTHSSVDHSLSDVLSATQCGLKNIFQTVQVNAKAVKSKLKSKKGGKKGTALPPEPHWMDNCIGPFPEKLITDIKQKFRIHKFFLPLAGVWIAVEVKHSYWIFNSYLTRRTLDGETIFQPPQYLCFSPLLFLLLGPLFFFYLQAGLTKSFFNYPLRQMCLGAFFIIVASSIGWRLSAQQINLTTELTEANQQQQKVRILNGFNCSSGFSYYFQMHPDFSDIFRPMSALDIVGASKNATNRKGSGGDDEAKTTKDRYIAQPMPMITNILMPTMDETFLRYANVPFLLDKSPIDDVVWDKRMPTDSFTYLMSIHASVDHTISLSAYGPCDALDEYALKIPVMHNKSTVDHVLVYMLHGTKNESVEAVAFHAVDYKRHMTQKPGLRVYVASDDKPQRVDVVQGGDKTIVTVPVPQKGSWQPPSDTVWLKEGDGHNLVLHTMGKKMHFNYSLGTAELVDILVSLKNDGTVVAKLLHALHPITISGMVPVSQYLILPLGEFLLGVVGLKQLLDLAPPKLRYFVQVDWYLTLAISNLVIVIVSQRGSLSTMHQQLSELCFFAMISFVFLLFVAARY